MVKWEWKEEEFGRQGDGHFTRYIDGCHRTPSKWLNYLEFEKGYTVLYVSIVATSEDWLFVLVKAI